MSDTWAVVLVVVAGEAIVGLLKTMVLVYGLARPILEDVDWSELDVG